MITVRRGLAVVMSPTIIIKAVNIITWVTRDLFTRGIARTGSMERNSRIVISPLGATNNKGLKGRRDNFNCNARNAKVTNTITKASNAVSVFNISDV